MHLDASKVAGSPSFDAMGSYEQTMRRATAVRPPWARAASAGPARIVYDRLILGPGAGNWMPTGYYPGSSIGLGSLPAVAGRAAASATILRLVDTKPTATEVLAVPV